MESIHPLQQYRESHEPPLSQGELAARLSVARETVNRWESGARKIDEDKLPDVSKITGIPAKELRPDLAKLFEGEASQ